jgi:membrane protease YdiL (CAAX protease family)
LALREVAGLTAQRHRTAAFGRCLLHLGKREVTLPASRRWTIRLWPAAAAVGLLFAVYLPAFAATALIRPRLSLAIPLVIGISLLVALALIGWLVRRGRTFASFGFAAPSRRSLWLAFSVGVPLAIGGAWLVAAFPHSAPFDANQLARWQLLLYFVIAAPVQEEIIFRGLIQSFLQQCWPADLTLRRFGLSPAVLFATVLFAIVHLGSGWPTVLGAIALSLLAGQLRRHGNSLVPAMIVHGLFNIASMLWVPA